MSTLGEDLRASLARVPLFQSLSEYDISSLAQLMECHTFKRGTVIFREGEEGKALYVVRSGVVKIASSTPGGDEIILAILSEGDFFGEMALLDTMPRSADAISLEASDLYILNRKEFLTFLWNNEAAIEAVLRALSLRLRKANDSLKDVSFMTIPARFAKKLLELCETHGLEEDGAVRIDLEIVQSDLAGMIGSTRESVNKELKVLRDKGVVSMEGKTIRVHNRARLRQRVH